MEISFHFQKTITLRNRNKLRTFLTSIFNKEQTAATVLNVIFCDDEYLLGINRSFLAHDYYTDIITFDLADKGRPIEGELYISAERLKENAKLHHTTLEKEMHRVIFHGVLHLCGYKDKSKKDIEVMRQMEDKYLSLYFDGQ